jgi:integrase
MIPDGRGLYLAIQPTGSKSWCMFFRGPSGKMQKLTLGPLDESGEEVAADPVIGAPLTLAGARRLAAEVNRQRALGQDVAAQRLREKAERTRLNANTFAIAAHDFITEHSMRKVRDWERGQARLLGLRSSKDGLEEIPGGLCDRWRERPITSITADDIHSLINDVRKRGIPGLERRGDVSENRARHAFAVLSKMFSWLVQQRRIETSPCSNVHRPDASEKRERVLTDGEIVKLWRATDEIGPPFGLVIKLLVLTGCRLNEIAGLRWEEVGEDGMTINLPGSRTKNGLPHTLSLSETAREVLAEVERLPGAELVFSTTLVTPISGWSKIKQRIDELMGNVPPWRIADLRRTCATHMAELGIAPPHIIEACLNHVSGAKASVAGIYNRAAYLPERRDALELWSRHVAELIQGRQLKVVPIRRS